MLSPNDNLYRAYISKSKEALEAMDVNSKKGILSWAVSASYYARYFAVYALLSKIGIKSEIHDCTLELFKFLFVDTQKIKEDFYNELKKAKDYRIEAQYYFPEFKNVKLQPARNFVLEIEKLSENLTKEEVTKLRGKLKLT